MMSGMLWLLSAEQTNLTSDLVFASVVFFLFVCCGFVCFLFFLIN